MNWINKTIANVAPRYAVKRAMAKRTLDVINSGYSETGASTRKKNMKGTSSNSKSTAEDINDNVQRLRGISRIMYQGGAPIATAAIKVQKTNVIGTGLVPRPTPDSKFLGISDEAALEWAQNVKREFDLWAMSKHCDVARLNNFYQLQAIHFAGQLLNGDAFCVPSMGRPTRFMPYRLRLHLFEADRVRTPNKNIGIVNGSATSNTTGKAKNGNVIFDGVEVSKSGAVEAYYVFDTYPQTGVADGKPTRIEAYGSRSGVPKILHTFIGERAEQYRGIPYLAPVIVELKNLSRYEESEITAAVIQSYFTAFIKYTDDKTSIPFNDIIPTDEQVDTEDTNSYEMGAGTVNVLGENEDVVFGEPSRPNKTFDTFMDTVTKHIGAALDIPLEVLTKHFKASYSASRAALLDFWKGIHSNRGHFVSDFTQPIYEIWLSEAVASGRVSAPGYFNDPAIKQAWASVQWVGPSQGQVDPVKEVNASKLKVEQGFSTRAAETTALNGGNWDKNMQQIKKENQVMAEAQAEGSEE